MSQADRPELEADLYSGSVTEAIAEHVTGILESLDENPNRPGLIRTPVRVARAYQFLLQGYHQNPRSILEGALFEEDYREMILVKDIDVFSLCEHHLIPFFGKAHVAYIPDGRVVGLSKIPRVVDAFARRLQLQERLTVQIRDAIEVVLRPKGIAVHIEATHLCVSMRGVQKQNAVTTTSSLGGEFLSSETARAEFMRLINGK